MANDNYPRGLFPYGKILHKAYYRVNTAQDIFLGEPVTLLSTGYVVAGSAQTGMVALLGVAVGFAGPARSGLATNDPFLDASDCAPLDASLPAGDRYVLIADDPQQEYVIQADTGGSALTVADAGGACDLLYRGATGTVRAGDSSTGWANLELDRSAIVATTASCVQVLRLHDVVNSDGSENSASNNYEKWVVRILHHQRLGGTNQTIV